MKWFLPFVFVAAGCSAIHPNSAGVLAYELGFAAGEEVAATVGDAASSVSDSLESALAVAVETSFRAGFADGLDSASSPE